MKNFYTQYLAAALLMAGSFFVPAYASRDYQDCCRSSCCCYECSCNPLYCGAWDVQLQVGVEPIHWSDRQNISLVMCTATPAANPISVLFEVPQFSTWYHVPWTIGGQIGYHHSDNVRLYVEFDYAQASHKSDVELQTVGATYTLLFNTGKYKLFEAYVGARYYWDRWCDRVAFFLGAKAGFVNHQNVYYTATITPPVPAGTFANDILLFKGENRPSGGIDFGFDICFCGCWSLVIAGAVIASCGPYSQNVNLNTGTSCNTTTVVTGVNNILIGQTGPELRFPVTVGARYSF